MKSIFQSLRFLVIFTLITGVLYPLVVTVGSQLLFVGQANGSLIQDAHQQLVGSSLIAQSFKNDKYFWPRPSAVDYNPLASGGSNLSPTSAALKTAVEERRKAGSINDMLFSSASGLDPDVSPEAALSQVSRIAAARHVQESVVHDMVSAHIEERQFHVFGERRVNVLKLNLALDQSLKVDEAK